MVPAREPAEPMDDRPFEEDERGEARFRELADGAPVFIWTADRDGMVDFVNRGWLDFTGRSQAEELGDTWVLGVHPDDAEGVESSWWRAHRRRVPWEREYRVRRHDGVYRWIVDRGAPRFVAHELVGWVGTATDIHERKEMESKLAAAAARDHEVAETLHVHPQTVRYRLGQLREDLGDSLDDPDVRFELHLALRARAGAADGASRDPASPSRPRGD